MQFGHALHWILWEMALANSGPWAASQGWSQWWFLPCQFECGWHPEVRCGVFPTNPGEEPLIVFPPVLPMGWKKSHQIFSTATGTIADLTNQGIKASLVHCPHPLIIQADKVVPINPLHPHMSVNWLRKPMMSPEAPVFHMSVMSLASSASLTKPTSPDLRYAAQPVQPPVLVSKNGM